jgi:hypothetical protein
MYGRSTTYPYSTYAVGGARSPRVETGPAGSAGRKLGLPVLALFGTASVVAISFASTDIEAPHVPAVPPSGFASQGDRATRNVGRAVEPGFSFELDNAQFGHGPGRPDLLPPTGGDASNAPSPAPHEPSPPPASRTGNASSPARLPRVEAVARYDPKLDVSPSIDRSSSPTDLRACQSDCPVIAGRDATQLPAETLPDTFEHSEAVATSAPADDPDGEPAIPTTNTLADSPAPQLVADALPDALITTDTQPGVPAQPRGMLAAIDANARAPRQANAGSSGRSPNSSLESRPARATDVEMDLDRDAVTLLSAVEVERPEPVSASVLRGNQEPRAARSETINPIKAHLDRIKKRYTPNEGLIDGDHGDVGSGLAEDARPSAAAPREVSESSLVVHDNEMVAIKLGELVSLFEDHLDRPLYVWMTSSSVASKFVSLKTLAAAGIKATFDPDTRQLTFSVDN